VSQPGGVAMQQQKQQGFNVANPSYSQQTSSNVFGLPVCLLSFEKCRIGQYIFSTLYQVVHKKHPELCVIVIAHVLYGEKFPFVHLQISTYSYLFVNFSDTISDVTECCLMT